MNNEAPSGEVELTPEQTQVVDELMAKQRITLLAQTAEDTPPAEVIGGGIARDVVQTAQGERDAYVLSLLVLPINGPRAYRLTLITDAEFGEHLGLAPISTLAPVEVEDNNPSEEDA